MRFDYDLTDRIGQRATIGLVILQADLTLEHDLRRLLPVDGVATYVTRVASAPEVTTDTLGEMRQALPAAVRLFPETTFDVVGYGCTSGTSVIGADAIATLIREGCDTTHVTEPVSALIAACRHLGVSRLGFLSPYVPEVSATLRDTLAADGIASPVFGGFDEASEIKVAHIDGPSVVRAACALADRGGIDAVFLSCTNLRTLDVIPQIEAKTGLPVMSSNQVLAWHLAGLSGIAAQPIGRLLGG